MKKVLALVACAVMAFALVACGKTQAAETTPAAAETTAVETTAQKETAPAAAETTAAAEETKSTKVKATSEDGLIDIELPDKEWAELPNNESSELFANGNSSIALNIYRADAEIPERHFADDVHKYVYEIAISSPDYVIIATGVILDETEYDDVVTAIKSIQINYDKLTDEILDHMRVNPQTYTIEDTNYDVWVACEVLNLRTGFSTEAPIITGLKQGTKLQATGKVLLDGQETGWTRVKYNGADCYAYSEFLSTTEVAPKPDPTPAPEGDDYIGYTYGGTSPWGCPLSVTLREVKDDVLTWTYTEVVDNNVIYKEIQTPFKNGYGEFYFEGSSINDDGNEITFNYAGNIKLQGGGVEFTYQSGDIKSVSPDGGGTAHVVEALPLGENTVELEKDAAK